MSRRSILDKFIGLITPIIFLQSLFFKFSGAPESVYIFTKVGMEPWGRYATGTLELIASILYFVPGWSWLGAFLAIDVMVGAIFSHLTLLGIEVQGDSGLLFGLAVTVLGTSLYQLHKNRYSVPLIGKLLRQSDELSLSLDSKFRASIGHRLPLIVILSFAGLCILGIIQQIFSINQIIGNQLPSTTEIRLAQWSYFMTLVSVFVAFLLTMFVVRVIEKPLHELISVCQKIAQGDRSTRSNLPLNSELGILSVSMNKMLEEIEHKEFELSEKSLNIQRLLRVVIHDVANPLTVIVGAARFATKNKEELSESQLKYWTRVSNASQKIEGIIRSTRDFEAVRSGVKKLELQKVPVLKCINSVMDIFEERVQSKSIQFSVQNMTALQNPEILVEETLFTSSVVSNIVSNAIKFSPENSKIEFLLSESDSANIIISIKDHGVGLPKEMLEKFKLGGNLQSRTGTGGELGTGFGLDIARSIMKSMNGDLTIQSKTKEESFNETGTQVLLILPRV